MISTGNKMPPVSMSDTASEAVSQFVYVRGTLFKQTKLITKRFAATMRTDNTVRETVTQRSIFDSVEFKKRLLLLLLVPQISLNYIGAGKWLTELTLGSVEFRSPVGQGRRI